MVTHMHDDPDQRLLGLFAHARETLPHEDFMRRIHQRLGHARRLRTLRGSVVISILAVIGMWMAPAVLEKTAAVVHALGAQSSAYGGFIISPWGWAVSMLIGLAVLVRTGALRRA